jgi:hypothetical protein
MTNNEYKGTIDALWEDYLSLSPHAETLVRTARRLPTASNRSKLIAELRNLDRKRLELLDQIDDLGKMV